MRITQSRLNSKDKALIKGALRQIFARSEYRKSIINASIIKHSDPKRPQVKKWFKCGICGKPEAVSYGEVDHISPISAIKSLTTDNFSCDNLIDKLWCDSSNLQVVHKEPCHRDKSSKENKARSEFRKQAKMKASENDE